MAENNTGTPPTDVEVRSRLDNGELVSGWKAPVRKLIDDVPDTLAGLISMFLQIGAALENFATLEEPRG